jgi:S-adenosylmethionine:tRNA ribosyltransferase-isomerase
VRVDEFNYHLPEDLIAQEPLPDRAASRLLVLDRGSGTWEDRQFREFPNYVRSGDCLILNNSRVFPSRLYAKRSAGTAVIEVFLTNPVGDNELTWEALVRPGRKVPVGERLEFANGVFADVLARGEHGQRVIRFGGTNDVYSAVSEFGHVPLPPYIKRPDTMEDRERYQTVFARDRGSVAAPTAGLHFTADLLEECALRGAQIAYVTLHVGLGTFQPIHVEDVEDVKLHAERFTVPVETMQTVERAKRRIAVGTTSVRAIESAGRGGQTDIFIYPGYRFRYVDALLTNFHLPQSSLLMLVCALAGRELVLDAYAHAVREGYRFFSYGDCMLVL